MKKAGDFLASFLDASLMEKAAGYSKLFSSWPAITTEVRMPSLSGHSWIRELEKAVLLVEADHPGWVQLLQTKQSELLKALRRRFPAENIAGISFRLCKEGPRPAGPAAVGPAGPAAVGSAADQVVGSPAAGSPASGSQAATTPERAAPERAPGAPAAGSSAGQDREERGLDSIKDGRLKDALTGLEKALGGKKARKG